MSGTEFSLHLDAGEADKVDLSFAATKPAMAVGGTGETGLTSPSDMHYFSLTRCQATGRVDTGKGYEQVTSGSGWIDHQWGSSWTAENDGWDWWGIQLADGTDILVFRHRDLATGKTFFPLATFMDKDGNQTVTHKIVFTQLPGATWKSPATGNRYPLHWALSFPEKRLKLDVAAAAESQEMPIFGPIGAIWEGACNVDAAWSSGGATKHVPGGAYMELVGYGSPAVSAALGADAPHSAKASHPAHGKHVRK
jgi:predicted secreted hydrolase